MCRRLQGNEGFDAETNLHQIRHCVGSLGHSAPGPRHTHSGLGLAVGAVRAREAVEYLQHRRKNTADGDAARETGDPAELLLEILPEGPVRAATVPWKV